MLVGKRQRRRREMRNKGALIWLIASIFCLISSSSLGASLTITNPSDSILGYFGEGSAVATIGQTFVVPNSQVPILDSVTLYLNPRDYEDAVDFAFYVYRWTGTKITGNSLFVSSQATASGSGGDFIPFTFNPNVNLQTGINYIWFISASGYFDGLQGRAGLLVSGTDTYTGGRIAMADNKNDFGALMTNNWTLPPQNPGYVQDLAFTMTFVPEPATLLLLGLGAVIIKRK